jgi:hypothetical protein
MKKILAALFLSLSLIGCDVDTQDPPPPPADPVLHGFVVKRCTSEEDLERWLRKLSDKPECFLIGVSTAYEVSYKALYGFYTYTAFADCTAADGGTK